MVLDSILIGVTGAGVVLGTIAATVCLLVVLIDLVTRAQDKLFGYFAWGTVVWGIVALVCWVLCEALAREIR